MDDEEVEYNVFEEFNIGVVSFLHKESLDRLLSKQLISHHIKEESLLLREQVINLENSDEWNIEAFRKSDRWRLVIDLSDKIKSELGV